MFKGALLSLVWPKMSIIHLNDRGTDGCINIMRQIKLLISSCPLVIWQITGKDSTCCDIIWINHPANDVLARQIVIHGAYAECFH